MASLLTFSRAPSCLSCLRRTFLDDGSATFANPLRTQWRGKKKLPKSQTINVRLLKDVAGYGRKGFIVPVAPARMRNMWYPQGRAAYVTPMEQKAQKSLIVERDYGYKMADKVVVDFEEDLEIPTAGVEVALLSPARSADLIRTLVPPILEFRRQPIQTPPITSEGASQPNAPPSSSGTPATAIFGSVTTGDIANGVTSALASAAQLDPVAAGDAARVVLAAEDVTIISVASSTGEEAAGRIKMLGEWSVEIRVKGSDPVQKTVLVLPEIPLEDARDTPVEADALRV